jgi:GTP cyclohydrolase II
MNPKTVECVAAARLPTDFGEFRIVGYRSFNSNEDFVVLVHGELQRDRPTLVRIHSNEKLGLAVDLRCYRQCAEILGHLGPNYVRLMSNNPEKFRALKEMGLKVVERVSLETSPTDAARNYLRTKKEKMGHLLEVV